MRRRPGPVMGWPPLFGRLAAELAELMPKPSALVLEHAHHLGRAHRTLTLLGGTLLPALDSARRRRRGLRGQGRPQVVA